MPHPTRSHATLALAVLLLAGLTLGCAPSGYGAVAAAVGTPQPSPAAAEPAAARATPRPTSAPTALPLPPPAPSLLPTPTPSPTPEPVGPFAMNIYGKGDFVSQATKDQCVSAAMQIMLNIVGPDNDRTARTQATLARLAKRLSDAPRGTEPLGWARGLERRGAGDYQVVVEATMGKAVRRAIAAIRETGRPVGLLVWRGAHSWVMHGFETTADPALTDDYEVEGVWVSDPWYPRVSSIWGASRKPNQRITVKQLREDYLKWRRPTGRYPGKDGNYVLVIPVGETAG